MTQSCKRSFSELQTLTVPQLATPEQFIVGVFRCWDAFLADPDPQLAWRELYPVFAYMDVLGALCAVDAAFEVVRQHRLRALAFHDVDSTPLGIAEARVLCGLASLQRGDARAAGAALHGALSSRGIHAVLPPFARIAAVLDVKGHRLPSWRDLPQGRASPQPHELPQRCDSPQPRHSPQPLDSPRTPLGRSAPQVRKAAGRHRLRDMEALRKADAEAPELLQHFD